MLARHVVVIGGTGYLGSRLIPRLIERGHTVTALVRPGARAKAAEGCRIVQVNPLDAAVRLGLVTLHEMLTTLVWAIEHPPISHRVIEVPEIRLLGGIS